MPARRTAMIAATLLACASGDGPGAPLRVEGFSPGAASFREPFELEVTGEGFVEPVSVRLGDMPGELLSTHDERLRVRFPALGFPGRLSLTVGANGQEIEVAEPLVLRGMAPEKLRFVPVGGLEEAGQRVRAWRHRGLLRMAVVDAGGLRWLEEDGPFVFRTVGMLEGDVGPLAPLDASLLAVVDGVLERVTPEEEGLARTPVEGLTQIEALAIEDGRALVVGQDPEARRRLFHLDLSSAQPVFPLDGFAVVSLALGDADGDGETDVLLGGKNDGPRLLLGDGHGAFRDAPPDLLPAIGSGPAAFVDADVDGRPDIVVDTSKGERVLLGGTRFAERTEAVLGTTAAPSALWSDLDADAALDRIESTPVRIGRNDGTGRFFDYTSRALSPAIDVHRVLSTADLDDDGDLDLVVATRSGALRMLENWAPRYWLDGDGDGLPDDIDVCPHEADPGQLDSDGNGVGDACEEAP